MRDERGVIGWVVAIILALAMVGAFALCFDDDSDNENDLGGMAPPAQVVYLS